MEKRQRKKKKVKEQKGITLISLLVASAILIILSTYVAVVLFDITQFDLRARSKNSAVSDAQFAMERMKYDIRNADSINSPALGETAEEFEIALDGKNVRYFVESNRLKREEDTGSGINTKKVISNQTQVKEFQVKRWGSQGTGGSSGQSTSISTQADWEEGINENTITNNPPGVLKTNLTESEIDLQGIYQEDNSRLSVTHFDSDKLKVFDNDTSTYWGGNLSNQDPNFVDVIWKLKLDQPYNLTKIRTYSEVLLGSIFIEASQDDITYTEICQGAANSPLNGWYEVSVGYSQAEYIRIRSYGAGSGGDWRTRIYEFEAYGSSGTATHTSASTQIDGGANISSWDTFKPTATVPANTSLSYRFRTSTDGTSWTSWSSSYPHASSIDLSSLDGSNRYLQVKSTLVSEDGTSTPSLEEYTVNYSESGSSYSKLDSCLKIGLSLEWIGELIEGQSSSFHLQSTACERY